MTSVVLVDYGAGNLRSASNALEEAARRGGVALDLKITSDPQAVRDADRVVLPGVGAFAACRAGLDAVPGLVEALDEAVRARGRPFLGVCVGMQLLATTGREHGEHPGLGWIPGVVETLKPADPALKIPHMGWNRVKRQKPHPVLDALGPDAWVYFVHSYVMVPQVGSDAALACDHGGDFIAAVARDNVLGVQFHPEKSQDAGLNLLGAFLDWEP